MIYRVLFRFAGWAIGGGLMLGKLTYTSDGSTTSGMRLLGVAVLAFWVWDIYRWLHDTDGGFSVRTPITEQWFKRGTPMDLFESGDRLCEVCKSVTYQAVFVAIVGTWGGLTMPLGFGRRSTRGKAGTKSTYALCQQCGSLEPLDQAAVDAIGQTFKSPLSESNDPMPVGESDQPTAQPVRAVAPETAPQPIDARLARLDELRQRAVITEDEHARKRQAILDEL